MNKDGNIADETIGIIYPQLQKIYNALLTKKLGRSTTKTLIQCIISRRESTLMNIIDDIKDILSDYYLEQQVCHGGTEIDKIHALVLENN